MAYHIWEEKGRPGVYRVQVTVKGKRKGKSFKDKKDALIYALETERYMKDGMDDKVEALLSVALDSYIKHDIEERSERGKEVKRSHCNRIKQHDIASMRIIDLTPEIMYRYQNFLLRTKAASTVHKYMCFIRSSIDAYVKATTGSFENPVSGFKLPNPSSKKCIRQVILLPKEIKEICALLKPEDAFGVKVAYETGLRLSEFCSLGTYDLDPDARTLNIQFGKIVGRKIDISHYLVNLIQDYIRDNSIHRGPLYQKHAKTLSNNFKKATLKLGMFNVRFHDLRHSALTNMYNSGMPTLKVMEISGHENPDMLSRYVERGNKDFDYLRRDSSL